jgi:DnaJ-class molecular chaperone
MTKETSINGFVQTKTEDCGTCNGEGVALKEEEKCLNCSGQRILKDEKCFYIEISNSFRDYKKVVFSGEGDHFIGMKAGDVIVDLLE